MRQSALAATFGLSSFFLFEGLAHFTGRLTAAVATGSLLAAGAALATLHVWRQMKPVRVKVRTRTPSQPRRR